MPHQRTPSLLFSPVLAGLLYFGAATLALLTSRFDHGLAIIWLANAFLMAELLTSPRAYWWRVILTCSIASMAATALFGMGPAAALPMVVANMAEAILLAIVYRRLIPHAQVAFSITAISAFVMVLCFVATPLSGLIAATTAWAVAGTPIGHALLQWYAGHVLGGLIFTPILAMILHGEMRRWFADMSSARKVEAALLLLLFAGIAYHAFFRAFYPMLFVTVMPLVLIAFRIGHVGSAAAIVILAVTGGIATIAGHGPISNFPVPLETRMQFFQIYLASCFLMSLPVSAELNGRGILFKRLRESEARYRLMADNSGDMMLNIDVDSIIRYTSSSAQHLGVAPDALVGASIINLIDPADGEIVATTLRNALAQVDATHRVEFRPRHRSGAIEWCEMVVRAIADDRGQPVGLVSSIRDMSAHKASQRMLLKAAYIDQLTGASSRSAFLANLETVIAETGAGRRACLALIDIDHFKSVNDRYGHGAGDMVLRAFVERLRPGIRGSDMLGRLGGEEFAVLLPGTDLIEASAICERLRTSVSAMRVTLDDGRSISVTFSAGLVELDSDESAAALLEAADKALYQAKDSGRNCLRLVA